MKTIREYIEGFLGFCILAGWLYFKLRGRSRRNLITHCYVAEVSHEGNVFKKTFFPEHWTRKQVIEKILEALKSVALVPNPSQHNKHYAVIGKTSENICIKIIITPENVIRTAYPIPRL